MATCAWCHNEYDKTFSVTYGDQTYVFDSFECAITMLAPTCAQCGCRLIGHGNEVDGRFYCCASCGAQGRTDGDARPRDCRSCTYAVADTAPVARATNSGHHPGANTCEFPSWLLLSPSR